MRNRQTGVVRSGREGTAGDEDSDYFTTERLMEIIYGAELNWPEQKLLARFMLDVKQRSTPPEPVVSDELLAPAPQQEGE